MVREKRELSQDLDIEKEFLNTTAIAQKIKSAVAK